MLWPTIIPSARRTYVLSGLIATLSLIIAMIPATVFSQPPDLPRLGGTRPFTPEVMAELAPYMVEVKSTPRLADTLPRKVKNWRHLPVVRNQALNNCGAFAPSYYYKTWQEARERGWLRPDPTVNPERVMSPGFTYPLSNGGEDEGANPGTVMGVICRYGIAPWSTISETFSYNAYPPEQAWRDAIPYRGQRVLSFDVTTDAGMNALKAHLASGDLAIMAFKLYADTHYDYGTLPRTGVSHDVIFDNGGEFVEWHAVTIIGYDDEKSYVENGVTKQGAFLAVNSWGQHWGIHDPDVDTRGFAWFSYEYVRSRRGGSLAGAVMAMEDRIGYQPTDLAVIDMLIFERLHLQLSLYVGAPDNRMSDPLPSFPNGGGTLPFNGRIVLDITEFSSLDPVCVTAVARDESHFLGGSYGTLRGKIYEFTVEKGDGQRIHSAASRDQPIDILAGINVTAHAGPLHVAPLGLEDELTTRGVRMAIADWNRDGFPDLAIGGGFAFISEMLRIYRNRADDANSQYAISPELTGVSSAALNWVDIDRDGLVDLAMIGRTGATGSTGQILRNNAPFGFEFESELPALTNVAMAWGDYNNDGAPDLAIAGSDSAGNAVTRLFRNDGTGQLVDSGFQFDPQTGVPLSWVDANNAGWLDLLIGGKLYQNNADGSFTLRHDFGARTGGRHAWGDFDGDGWLDLAWCGIDYGQSGSTDYIITRIFRNTGNFQFINIGADLVGVHGGSLAWGDFDNDGRGDLVVSGYTDDLWDKKTTRIYRQQSNGAFKDIGADLLPVTGGETLWGDFNNNGLLDLYLSGNTLNDPDTGRFLYGTRLLVNRLERVNQPPSPPANLAASWNPSNGEIVLTWDPSQDAETPEQSISYRVRAGTWPGGNDVISGADQWGLIGPHPPMRVAANQPGRRISRLNPGRYFWSAQAIDGGLAHSEWSAEQMFTLGDSGIVSGDANQDGRIDVADIVTITRMATSEVPARLDMADLDGNGRIDGMDARILAGKLTGGSADSAYWQVGQRWFDGSGGDLVPPGQSIQVIVPEAVGPTPFDLKVEISTTDLSYGPDAEPLAWKLTGLPLDSRKPITIRIRDTRQDRSQPPFIAIGTDAFIPSISQVATGYQVHEARAIADGWIEFELPAMEEPGPVLASSLESLAKTLASYQHILVIYLLKASQWKYDGGNFRIMAPLEAKNKLPALAKDLEEALAYYRDTLQFDLSRRNWANYPVVVTVRDLGVNRATGEPVAGYAVSSTNYNHLAIEINTRLMDKTIFRRTAAAHEVFHLVQALYDTRGRLARKVSSPNLWLDEATATYMENHFSPDPDNYVPDLLGAYKLMILTGFEQAERVFGQSSTSYGYAAAPMIAHLITRNGNDAKIIRTLYEKIQSGKTGLEALSECFPDHPLRLWYSSLIGELLRGNYYAGPLFPVGHLWKTPGLGGDRKFTLKDPNQLSLDFAPQRFPALSAGFSFIQFDPAYPQPASDARLAFQVKTDEPLDIDLSIFEHKRHKDPNLRTMELLGRGQVQADKGRLLLQVPEARNLVRDTTWFIPVISNIRETAPFNSPLNTMLRFGIVRDFVNHQVAQHTYRFGTVWVSGIDTNWPQFSARGSFDAYDTTRIDESYKNPSNSNAIPALNIYPWGDPIEPITFRYQAYPQRTTHYMTLDDYDISLIYREPLQYRLLKYRQDGGKPVGVFVGPWEEAATLTKTLDMEDNETVVGYSIGLRFNYHVTVQSRMTGEVLIDEEHTRTTTTSFSINLIRQ